jgi:hypothetical protein
VAETINGEILSGVIYVGKMKQLPI